MRLNCAVMHSNYDITPRFHRFVQKQYLLGMNKSYMTFVAGLKNSILQESS